MLQMKTKQREQDTDPLRTFDRWDTLLTHGVRLNGRRPVEAYYREKVEKQIDG